MFSEEAINWPGIMIAWSSFAKPIESRTKSLPSLFPSKKKKKKHDQNIRWKYIDLTRTE